MADIIETALKAGTFTTLLALLQATGLLEQLHGAGPFTLFAPRDSAFARLPAGILENLQSNLPQLRRVLAHHIAAGRVTTGGIKGRHRHAITSLAREQLFIDLSPSGHLQVNNAMVTRTDILADNGVIHIVDSVMLPGSVSGVRVA